jgi:hypothetical protein
LKLFWSAQIDREEDPFFSVQNVETAVPEAWNEMRKGFNRRIRRMLLTQMGKLGRQSKLTRDGMDANIKSARPPGMMGSFTIKEKSHEPHLTTKHPNGKNLPKKYFFWKQTAEHERSCS